MIAKVTQAQKTAHQTFIHECITISVLDADKQDQMILLTNTKTTEGLNKCTKFKNAH